MYTQTVVVCWCFEPSQRLGVTSWLNTQTVGFNNVQKVGTLQHETQPSQIWICIQLHRDSSVKAKFQYSSPDWCFCHFAHNQVTGHVDVGHTRAAIGTLSHCLLMTWTARNTCTGASLLHKRTSKRNHHIKSSPHNAIILQLFAQKTCTQINYTEISLKYMYRQQGRQSRKGEGQQRSSYFPC